VAARAVLAPRTPDDLALVLKPYARSEGLIAP